MRSTFKVLFYVNGSKSLISASFSIIELEKNQCLMYLITSGVLLLKYTVI